jgi:hypothetical protein
MQPMSYFLLETLLLLHCRRKSTPFSWHEKAPQMQGFLTINGTGYSGATCPS